MIDIRLIRENSEAVRANCVRRGFPIDIDGLLKLDADARQLGQEAEALRTAAGQMSAKMRAVRIVSAASVSRRDLEARLVRKGEDPQQAKEAVAWMEDLHLVDDRATAEQVVSSCISKGYGLARAKQALYEKRIPKEYWDEALADYPDQTEKITAFLKSRLDADSDEKQVRRAVDALIRRGHSYGTIRRALDALSFDTEDFQEEF